MLRKLNKAKAGFTLVEIMIVVAIIALLATIAVPNFLRARKRAQATTILEEMRVVEGAKDTWAIENNKKGTDQVTFPDITPYFKPGTRLANSGGADLIGNAITLTNVDTPAKVHADTVTEFNNVIDNAASFWGSYAN